VTEYESRMKCMVFPKEESSIRKSTPQGLRLLRPFDRQQKTFGCLTKIQNQHTKSNFWGDLVRARFSLKKKDKIRKTSGRLQRGRGKN